jgi:drug/metabolite transporter (DMT)-like permease
MKSPAGSHPLRSDALLLLTAAIWGFAFVAQRASMEHIGPFTFNALRFGIGSLVLLPFVLRRRTETASAGAPSSDGSQGVLDRKLLTSALIAGMVLFAGASLQQTGLVYTTAGKAGFITGLYVILVPLFGLLWRHRPGLGGWLDSFCSAWMSASRSRVAMPSFSQAPLPGPHTCSSSRDSRAITPRSRWRPRSFSSARW